MSTPQDNISFKDQIQNLLSSGKEAIRQSKPESAVSCFENILELDPQNEDALFQLGLMAYKRKEFYLAAGYLQIAQFINPHNVTLLSSLGSAYKELKQFLLAKETYIKALAVKSDFAPLHYNFGNLLNDMNEFEGAAHSYALATQLDPNLIQAHVNLGNMLTRLKKFDAALKSYDQALRMNPQFGLAYANRGKLFKEMNNFEAAMKDYDLALNLSPEVAKVHILKAEILNLSKKYDEAVQYYDQALILEPHFENARGLRLHNKMLNCNWSNFESDVAQLTHDIAHHRKATQPAQLLSILDSAAYQLKASQIFVEHSIPENISLGPLSPKDYQPRVKRKIKVAYVSADFKNHAVCILMAELFESHNKDDFEWIAFDSTPVDIKDNDPMRLRVLSCFDQCIDIQYLSDKEAAQLARQLKVDVAVDLGGHTYHARTGIFAYRAAPIQMSYIGYLGTLGAPYMDYLLADRTLIPNESQQYYQEKIIYLPCYQVNDSKRKVSDRVFNRQELGLPETGFVFCCFNNNYKITPETFSAWIKILNSVPNSVLFLLADNPSSKENMLGFARHNGLDEKRLVFGQRLEPAEYLARYRMADLFLDTTPYNAGTTASDALWVGLPVLTMAGESFVSRMAASALMGMDLPELVTHTRADYIQTAIDLGNNPQGLLAIKEKLSNHKKTSLLFNATAFAKSLEASYKEALGLFLVNEKPKHLVFE
jgi:predicted O-linked N-acetylglucosamine transferase (SPINDLY family)